MKLKIVREEFSDFSTIGSLYIDDVFFSYTLEDVDRKLDKEMPLSEIESTKIVGETCIPYGTYQVIINASVRFKRLMPLIVAVPGFEGVRIHAGNTSSDTAGCILLGRLKYNDALGESAVAFNSFFPTLRDSLEHMDCFIEIRRAELPRKVMV